MPHDNQQELFYWVDEEDIELGSITRAEAHDGSKKIHRVIDVAVFDTSNRLLFQKRSKNKDLYAGFYSFSVGGHVTYGQSYKEAARRETQEELGFKPQKLQLIGKLIVTSDQEIEYAYIFKVENVNPKHIVYDPIEIESIKWVPTSEIAHFVATNQVVPQVKQILQYLKLLENTF